MLHVGSLDLQVRVRVRAGLWSLGARPRAESRHSIRSQKSFVIRITHPENPQKSYTKRRLGNPAWASLAACKTLASGLSWKAPKPGFDSA